MIENVTVAKCLEFAIETERIGARLYDSLARRFSADRELRALLEGLGKDEAEHEQMFRGLRDRLLARAGDQEISFEQQNYLRAMSISEIFSGSKGLRKNVESLETRDDALERALLFEKATLSYYQAVSDVLGAEETLDSLIAIEKSHVVKIMQLMLTGAKFRGLADGG